MKKPGLVAYIFPKENTICDGKLNKLRESLNSYTNPPKISFLYKPSIYAGLRTSRFFSKLALNPKMLKTETEKIKWGDLNFRV